MLQNTAGSTNKSQLKTCKRGREPPQLERHSHRHRGSQAPLDANVEIDEIQALGHDAGPLILSERAEELFFAEQREGTVLTPKPVSSVRRPRTSYSRHKRASRGVSEELCRERRDKPVRRKE